MPRFSTFAICGSIPGCPGICSGINMQNRYIYRDEDVTLDVIIKIEHVVRLIARETGKPFDDCLYEFYRSKVYEMLQKTGSLMWVESAEFITDEYFRENPL